MTEVYEFLYTDNIHESAMATMSLHRTKKGAYKAMRAFLESKYAEWYDERILKGKDKDWVDKFGLHCAWAIQPIMLYE
jgi:hypothetical protein